MVDEAFSVIKTAAGSNPEPTPDPETPTENGGETTIDDPEINDGNDDGDI
jgi:hypothetical protein